MTAADIIKARRAAQAFAEGIFLMRSVLPDDECYLHCLKEVEARVLGERSYMEAVLHEKPRVAKTPVILPLPIIEAPK